ncbi:cytochrome P450 [Paxillus ammoniavirescens]|nr:cytochrome P450 [Paxillus ammoniavirescens]
MSTATKFESLQILFAHSVAVTRPISAVNVVCAFAAFYVLLKATKATRRRLKTTSLRGPPNPSFLYGVQKTLRESPDQGALFEKWAEEYGVVYEIPTILGESRIVLCDPKAIAHFSARDSWTYVSTPFGRAVAENMVDKGISWAEGESHRRQRKAFTPAFTNAAIRTLTSVFYDSAYKARDAWDSLIESGGERTVIEVQNWMNHISLDTVGIAGFSHDFGSLDGKTTPVTDVFNSFGASQESALAAFLFLLSWTFPVLTKPPTSRTKLVQKLNQEMGEISNVLLTRTREEREARVMGDKEEKSIIGLLIKSESEGATLRLSSEEVIAQAKVLLVAGYETTSISLTWALIELALNPDVQNKLREELLEFGADPTYDQLANSLPYLDAVVHETLRLHPPIPDATRIAAEDDIIPLSEPVRTKSGNFVDHISVAKGTVIVVSKMCINRSAVIWGPEAKEFRPARWLEGHGIPGKAKEVQGHRHLLTFGDGPRACIGKGFAIAEFKSVLSVLVKNFVLETRDGPETKIEVARGIFPRPKVAGEEGTAVPLRVRRLK